MATCKQIDVAKTEVVISRRKKSNLNLICNLGHNNLRLFYVLPNFLFTISETNHDYY